jgi:hypothetical protein
MPADYQPKYDELKPGDSVAPSTIYGEHAFALPLAAGLLPDASVPTAQDVLDASLDLNLPGWMLTFHASVLASVADILDDLVRPGTPKPFTFDLNHRLDEFSFVGRPVGGAVPILAVRVDEATLADATGAAFLKVLQAWVANAAQVLTLFDLKVHPVTSIGLAWAEHVPAIRVVETYRLTSALASLELGAPAGTVAMTPGEKRTFSIKQTSSLTTTTKDSLTVVEGVTEKSTQSFSREFTKQATETKQSTSSFKWTSGRTANSPSGSSTDTSDQGQTWSIQDVVAATTKTTESLTQERSRSTTMTLSRENQAVQSTSTEDSRSVALDNASRQCVTIVYHHLNARYRVHLDLVDVRLVYSGETAADGPKTISLRSPLADQLRGVVKAGSEGAAAGTIADALSARYSALGFLEIGPAKLALKDAPEGDVNRQVFSRAALVENPRRRAGPLPVCLSSTDHVVQTPNLHAVPRLSEFSVPPSPSAA